MPYKTILHVLAGGVLFAALAAAQPLCNTGFAGGTGTCGPLQSQDSLTGSPGYLDGNWYLQPYLPSFSAACPTATTIVHPWVDKRNILYNYWLADDATSQWITPQVENNLGGFYVYQTTFAVPAGTTAIGGWAASDNEIAAIFLRDQNLGTCVMEGPVDPVNIPGSVLDFTAFAAFPPMTVTATAADQITLYFEVENRGIGGIVTQDTPTGFRVEFSSSTHPFPSSVAAGDFNGDGTTDLAVANGGENSVSVLLGEGKGSFKRPVDTTVGTNPVSMRAADFNHDGKLDLAVVNSGTGIVSIMLGKGNGKFKAGFAYDAGASAPSIAVADFNQDGNPDLAVVTPGSTTVAILLGKGDGTFTPPVQYPIGAGSGSTLSSIAAGDLNGDGIPDLAIADAALGYVYTLRGLGDGTFHSPQSIPLTPESTPASIAIATLIDGGYGALVVVAAGTNNILVVLTTDGVTWDAPVAYSLGKTAKSPNPVSVAIGDLNGDGIPDLAVADAGSNTVSVLLGTGTGRFNAAINYPAGTTPEAVIAVDLNGDGIPDLVTANNGSNNVSVLLGNGDGTFQPRVNHSAGPEQ
jgi:hypothetical protein